MDPLENPFAPGAGSPPPELVGRGAILEQARIALHRLKAGRPAKSMILVGLRGVGKTVLLNRIRSLAEEDGFRALSVEAHESKPLPALLLPHLRQVLFSLDAMENVSEKVKRGFRVLRSFIGGIKAKAKINDLELELGVDPERGTADSGDLESDLSELFVAIAEAAADRGKAIAICIDELQYLSEPELSALIMALHRVAQRALPLVVVGAGLPQIIALAGRSKSYAERLFDYPAVGPLAPLDAIAALQLPVQRQGVRFAEDALCEVLKVTGGYPYFLQQWGYEAWDAAAGPTINLKDVEEATVRSVKELDQSFFRVRFDRLTPREKDYLRALAELGSGPRRSSDIAEIFGVKVQAVAPLRNGLIHKGMIYSPAHGDIEFTVPLFGEFMLRVIPKTRFPHGLPGNQPN
jgi:AAA ATPase domain